MSDPVVEFKATEHVSKLQRVTTNIPGNPVINTLQLNGEEDVYSAVERDKCVHIIKYI